MGNTARLLIDGKTTEMGNRTALEMNVEVVGKKAPIIAMLMEVFSKNENFFNMCHVAVHMYQEQQEEAEEEAKKEVEEAKKKAGEQPTPEQTENTPGADTFTVTFPVIKNTEDLLSFFKDVGKKLEKKMIEVAETLPKESK